MVIDGDIHLVLVLVDHLGPFQLSTCLRAEYYATKTRIMPLVCHQSSIPEQGAYHSLGGNKYL
jgi:hypothetical protein